MLALLSMRSEVRTGRSILTPSSASSPPPSWIHSSAKRVAAAACSSPLPESDTHSSFSWFIQFYFLLGIRLKCFQWEFVNCRRSHLFWGIAQGSHWWWGVSLTGSHKAPWRRTLVAKTPGLPGGSWHYRGKEKGTTQQRLTVADASLVGTNLYNIYKLYKRTSCPSGCQYTA